MVNPGNPNNYIKTQCFSIPTAPKPGVLERQLRPGTTERRWTISSAGDLPALACFNLRGNSGRNILIGPGLMDLDFSVYKNNYIRRISEVFNIQFRAEMFDILNHPNFGPPTVGDGNTDIFGGTGTPNPIAGTLVRTVGEATERQIQFALKVIF